MKEGRLPRGALTFFSLSLFLLPLPQSITVSRLCGLYACVKPGL